MIALWVLNFLDWLTTTIILSNGGTEANPIVAPFAYSWWQLGLVKLGVMGVFTAMRPGKTAVRFLVAWYVVVVGWNLTQLVG